MTRVVSCRVIDPASHRDGDVQTALATGERFRRRPLPPTDGLPGRLRGCGSGFGAGYCNTAGDIPTGLLFDVLA
ncbi:MAG: hypothetical protein J7M40_20545 [Planctomycetes bacterium]|nr:hypothetical protein [Planctomycetota bacterium]